MGNVSDFEEVMGKALVDVAHKKRMRAIWALATSLGTVILTTATVTWTVNDKLHDIKEAAEKIRGEQLVLAKNIEKLETHIDELDKAVARAQSTADTALLYAQLTGKPKL